jgi:hypothetical protein
MSFKKITLPVATCAAAASLCAASQTFAHRSSIGHRLCRERKRADLQKLSLERQSQLLLARLAVLYKWNPNNCPINKNNLRLRPGYGLTQGYTEEEASGLCDLLLANFTCGWEPSTGYARRLEPPTASPSSEPRCRPGGK